MAIEDYFKGSSQAYGQLAGSLLAGRRKEDKKEAKRALIASTVMASFGALQNQQKQTIIDGANDVKEQYSDIFSQNKSEFEAYEDDRALLKRYNANPETFLNDEVIKIIDKTDEAVAAGVTFANKDNEPEGLRKLLESSYNEEKEKLEKRMLALKADKRVTTKTFEQFNQKAADEFKAALALVEDDPTKKGLIKAAWNRIFKTERNDEGELVTKNVELLDLQAALKNAKDNRTTFRDSIINQVAEEKLYEPLIFKSKPKNISETYAKVIPALMQTFASNKRYKNLETTFYSGVVDDILKENPNLSINQIKEEAFSKLITNKIDPTGYRTEQGIRLANRESLLLSYEESEDKDTFIGGNPEKLFQLMDAYNDVGASKQSQGLAVTYKEILETNKDFSVNESDKLSYIERIRLELGKDKEQNKQILGSSDALGLLGKNTGYAINYYKKNNKDWNETLTPAELEDSAVRFVLRNMQNSPNEIRMTKADVQSAKGFSLSSINDLPDIIESLNKANQPISKYKIVKDSYIKNIKNPRFELSPDEIIEQTAIINDAFKDIDLEEDSSENIISDTTGIQQPNITDVYEERGIIKRQEGRKLTYLTNWEENMDKLDLSTLSIDDLGYLATIQGDDLYNYLGLDTNVSLTPFRVQGLGYKGGIKTLRANAREAMEQKLMDERGIGEFKADGIVSGMFMNKDNDWNTLKNDETINTFFETLKNNILS